MKIDGCEFPDDLLYDSEGLVWARPSDSGDAVIGITSIHAAIAGRIAKVTAKSPGVALTRGAAIGFLESGTYFGPIRAPVGGVLEEVNQTVLAKPRTMIEGLYGDGWVGGRTRLASRSSTNAGKETCFTFSSGNAPDWAARTRDAAGES